MLESVPQPDGALFVRGEYGGRVEEGDGFCLRRAGVGGEVSQSSRSYDLSPKLARYQRAEVRE
jgi:hypothetical protein